MTPTEIEQQAAEDAFLRGFHDIPDDANLQKMSYVQLAALLSSCESGSPRFLVVEAEKRRRDALPAEDKKIVLDESKNPDQPPQLVLTVKALWHDPVLSNVIAGGILSACALFFALWPFGKTIEPVQTVGTIQASTPPATLPQIFSPITLDTLKNLTYRIDKDEITLQDGNREFNPDSGQATPILEKAIFAHLVDHAFGDLDGDGNVDAVAVLQVSDGGSGIYYYLAPVFNDHGAPKVHGPAVVIGDRLEFRSVSIAEGKVKVQLLMHKSSDALCCPTLFRVLEFTVSGKALNCTTKPCSE